MGSTMQLALVVVGVLAMSGCAAAHPGIVSGGFYSGYTLGSAVGPAESGSKTGEACAMSILGVVGVGDASIEKAKKDGGITKVATVDHDAFNILSVYGSVCTIVTGE